MKAAVSRRLMPTLGALLLTDGDDQRTVHLQGLDRRPAGCGVPEQPHALPAEVVVPQIEPRMEEGDVLATRWIDGGLARGFAE